MSRQSFLCLLMLSGIWQNVFTRPTDQGQIDFDQFCDLFTQILASSLSANQTIKKIGWKLIIVVPEKNREQIKNVDIFSNAYLSDKKHRSKNDPTIIRLVNKAKHPAKIMVLGIVTSNGKKCPIIFFNENISHCQHLPKDWKSTSSPGWRESIMEGNYIFQQDNAKPHTAKAIVDFLKKTGIPIWIMRII